MSKEITNFNIVKNGTYKNISTLCLTKVAEICSPI